LEFVKRNGISANQKTAQTETAEFKKWFGGSKVVDENGRPLRAVHFTNSEFDEFNQDARDSAARKEEGFTTSYGRDFVFPRKGFFFFAGDAPQRKTERIGMPVYIRIERPLDFRNGLSPEQAGKVIDLLQSKINVPPMDGVAGSRVSGSSIGGLRNARKNGITGQQLWDLLANNAYGSRGRMYDEIMDALDLDGMIFESNSAGTITLDPMRGRGDGKTYLTVVPREPTQIKSAVGNRGTFDSTDPNILMSQMTRREFLDKSAKLSAGAVAAAAVGDAVITPDAVLGKATPLTEDLLGPVDGEVEQILRSSGPNALKEAIASIAQNGPEEVRGLASRLEKLLPDGKVDVVVNDVSWSNAHGSVSWKGGRAILTLYTAEDRTGLTYGTILHESLHAAVIARYGALSTGAVMKNYDIMGLSRPHAEKAIDQFEAVWREFKTATRDETMTDTWFKEARNNPDEFFVRALTDANLQAYMATKEYEGKTLWERFTDWVKYTLFGFSRTGTVPSWLDAALMASNDLIEGMAADNPDFVVPDALDEYRNQSHNDLYSRRDYPPGDSVGFAVPDETLTTFAIRKIQDKFKVLKDLQVNIAAAGGSVDDSNNAYQAEEAFHGKAENDIRLAREKHIEPLAKGMANYNIKLEDLDDYLSARHAAERNAHIASINPNMPDGGSGMTDKEAGEVLAAAKRSGKERQYEKLADIVYSMLQAQRDIIRAGNLEDKEGLVDAWEAKYKYYVPLKGWADDTKGQGIPGTGKGYNVAGKESRRALGRSTRSASPTSYAISDLTRVIIRNRKNEVGNALLKLIEDNPNPEYWEIFTDKNPDTQRSIVMEDGKEVVKTVPIPMAMMNDRYFMTKRDGKAYYIKLHDERLMRAMKNLGPETNNGLIRTMAGINRILSALNTSYSPEFLVSNFSRDIQTAILNLHAEQSLPAGKGKAAGKAIVAKTVKAVPTAYRAIRASQSGKKLTGAGAKYQEMFDQFRADGAKTGYFDMKDIDGQAKELNTLVAMAQGGVKGNTIRFLETSKRVVENLNTAVENAVRLSAYTNAIEAGLSRPQAASLAKNMTVNFNRRGEVGTTLNALYMFANASIQGVANFARTMGTLGGDEKLRWKNLNNAQRIAIGIVAGSYMIAYANRIGAGEDDDDENWYDKVPDYVKERNLVLMKSLFGGPQDGSYYKIPLPYGYNVFSVLGGGMESLFNGGQDTQEVASDLSLAVLGSFSPIGFQQSETIQGMLLKNAAPSVIKPVVEIALNENFMGSSIYNENFPFGTQKPDSALGRRSTIEAYRKVAVWLNESTGGSQFRSGAIDVNPDVMQYVVDYFGGSAYSFFGSKIPDYAIRKATGVETEDYRTPFLSRVTGRVLPYDDMSTFYERRDLLGQIEAEMKTPGLGNRAEFMRDNRQMIRLIPLVGSTEKRLSALRKRRDHIYQMDLSLQERDSRVRLVEAQMKAAVDRFNKAYTTAQSR
jgi:hypothetical protein